MKKIIGIGNALVDVLVQMKDDSLLTLLQLPKGGMTVIDEERMRELRRHMQELCPYRATGGSAGNTILALANLGADPGFIGKIGRDETGDFFADTFGKLGVRTCLTLCETPTGVAHTFISADGERTFGTYLGAAAQMVPEEITAELFSGYDILYLEGYLVLNAELMEKICRTAKEAGLTLCIDLGSYNMVQAMRPMYEHLITEYMDIVFANEDESFAYTHLNPEESVQMIAEQCDIAVVKVGKNGSYVQQGSTRHHIGAITTSCTDSTGAGDYFAGGFLHALSDGFDIRRCAEIGTIAAGRVVEVVGTKLPDEQWEEIRRICALYRGFMQKYDKD